MNFFFLIEANEKNQMEFTRICSIGSENFTGYPDFGRENNSNY